VFFSKGWRPDLEYYEYWWTPRSAAMFLESTSLNLRVRGKFSWNTLAQIRTQTFWLSKHAHTIHSRGAPVMR
jgi:hypothetical protein